jgi:hypothetical protein
MNPFDARWSQAAKQARQSPPPLASAPWGFADRIVAHATHDTLAHPSPDVLPDPLWDRLLPRLLAGATLVLALCLAMEFPYWTRVRPLDPGIENTVAQLVWSL